MTDALQRAIGQLLRPFVKALIDGGLTFPALVHLLREAYVDIAQSDFGINGKPPTHSRIAVLTGVHRKEIRRLANLDLRRRNPAPTTLSLSAKVIAAWCSQPDYLDANGHPRPLPRSAPEGQPSLDQLVAAVSQDVRARSLLEEWLRLGVVESSKDEVRLKQAGFVPSAGYEEKVYYFGRHLRDHIAAGAHNLAASEPAFLDRAVYYDGLSSASLDELRTLCAQRGEDLLLEINRHARRLADRDRDAGAEPGRMTFGAYFYAENEAGAAGDEPD